MDDKKNINGESKLAELRKYIKDASYAVKTGEHVLNTSTNLACYSADKKCRNNKYYC